jgi:hypothetical protein
MTAITGLHAAAIDFAKRGWSVFPCRARAKIPACKHGFLDATTDAERIGRAWQAHPDLNIGVATGATSGFFVLDVDGETGEASLRALEQQHGVLPATIEAITGKGRHVYFRIGEHGPVKNSAGQVGDGLDIRGDGGYVLAPLSIHPSGRAYEWSVDSSDNFADAPEWLHGLIHAGNGNGMKGKPLEHWHRVLTSSVPLHTRNVTLASICGKLVHSGLTDMTLLFDTMLCINKARCEPPLGTSEVENIVASVVRSHLKGLRANA